MDLLATCSSAYQRLDTVVGKILVATPRTRVHVLIVEPILHLGATHFVLHTYQLSL